MTNSMIQKGLAAAEVIFNQMDVKPEIDDGTIRGYWKWRNDFYITGEGKDRLLLNKISFTYLFYKKTKI